MSRNISIKVDTEGNSEDTAIKLINFLWDNNISFKSNEFDWCASCQYISEIETYYLEHGLDKLCLTCSLEILGQVTE